MTNFLDHYYEQLAESVVRIMKFNSMNDEEMAKHMMEQFTTKEVCHIVIQFILDASKETKREREYWYRVKTKLQKL
jgi:hypothetical protein